MFRITDMRTLAPKTKLMEIYAQEMSEQAGPGQFVILRIDEKGERFPLTIAGADPATGTIRCAFTEVGKSTIQLGRMKKEDHLLDVVGPLGNGSEIKRFGTVLCVGGGVMTAPLHFVASMLKKARNRVIGVVGARTKDSLVFTEDMQSVCNECHIATDDGSLGYESLEFIESLLDAQKIHRVVTMGSVITMKTVSEMTQTHKIPTMVTLTPIMVDGTGMCGCCRVIVGRKTRYACIDGPEFDGHEVDWDLLVSRKHAFLPEERIASLLYEREW